MKKLLGKKADSLDELEVLEKKSITAHNSLFNDGKRRIDFILIYRTPELGDEKSDITNYRKNFLLLLEQRGIQHETVRS